MLINKLQDYLREITGEPLVLTRIPDSGLSGIPFFYCTTYDFYKLKLFDVSVIMAVAKTEEEQSPSEYSRQLELLKRHFKVPVAVVLSHLESYKRTRLIQSRVPFVIPSQQLFLPPFADFRERIQRKAVEDVDQLSAAAQLALLYHLHNKNATQCSLRNLAGKLGYSAMTLSNVSVELRATGLCEDSPDGRKRGLAFRFDGNDLWTRAKPLLSSPVIKKIWVRTESCSFPLAGMSALSEYTMINDDNWVTFACRNTRLKKLIKDGRISALQDPENATGLLEVWKYDPDILANNGRVDRLSLYLSMEDRPDERVRSSLDHLLEDMTW